MSTKMDMELRASGEDYLEAVLILGQSKNQVRAIDVAQYLGYAKTSVSHGLRLLRQGGFLSRDADGYLYLTEAGRDMAERIYAKHRFFAGWLIRAGAVPNGGDSSETASVLGMVRRLLYGYGDVHRVQA